MVVVVVVGVVVVVVVVVVVELNHPDEHTYQKNGTDDADDDE